MPSWRADDTFTSTIY